MVRPRSRAFFPVFCAVGFTSDVVDNGTLETKFDDFFFIRVMFTYGMCSQVNMESSESEMSESELEQKRRLLLQQLEDSK